MVHMRLLTGMIAGLGLIGPVIGWCEEPATPAPAADGYVSPVTSQDGAAHLNYASILFYKAGATLQQDPQTGQRLFGEVEAELQMALSLSEAAPDDVARSLLRSQTSYLLGELAFHVHHDKAKAKVLYQDALKYYAGHGAAAASMIKLEVAQ